MPSPIFEGFFFNSVILYFLFLIWAYLTLDSLYTASPTWSISLPHLTPPTLTHDRLMPSGEGLFLSFLTIYSFIHFWETERDRVQAGEEYHGPDCEIMTWADVRYLTESPSCPQKDYFLFDSLFIYFIIPSFIHACMHSSLCLTNL